MIKIYDENRLIEPIYQVMSNQSIIEYLYRLQKKSYNKDIE